MGELVSLVRVINILSTDTSSQRGGVCLARGDEVICELNVNLGLQFSQKLLEIIDTVLQLAQVKLEQLDALAVVTGPGSFTGLRVGIASMKALAFKLRRPLVGVTTLDALAESARAAGTLAAFMDARRLQVFAALYTRDSEQAPPVLIREGEVATPQRWIASLARDNVKFVGDGAHVYRSLIEQAGHTVLPSDYFLARSAASSALRKLDENDLPAPELIDACYLRPSDAEIGLQEALKART